MPFTAAYCPRPLVLPPQRPCASLPATLVIVVSPCDLRSARPFETTARESAFYGHDEQRRPRSTGSAASKTGPSTARHTHGKFLHCCSHPVDGAHRLVPPHMKRI